MKDEEYIRAYSVNKPYLDWCCLCGMDTEHRNLTCPALKGHGQYWGEPCGFAPAKHTHSNCMVCLERAKRGEPLI